MKNKKEGTRKEKEQQKSYIKIQMLWTWKDRTCKD